MEQKKHRKAAAVLMALAMSLTVQTAAFSPGIFTASAEELEDSAEYSYESEAGESEDSAEDFVDDEPLDASDSLKAIDEYTAGEDPFSPLVDSEFYAYAGTSTSRIVRAELVDDVNKVKFYYENIYAGDGTPEYGFLCYRDGKLNADMTVDMIGSNGVQGVTKKAPTGVIVASDKGSGIYLRPYIKAGDSIIYGEQIFVKHSELMGSNGTIIYTSGYANGYLTPQDYGANGNDDVDDTVAFRKLFQDAYCKGINERNNPSDPGWRRCKPIHIPAGNYIISEPIIDKSSRNKYEGIGGIVSSAAFEVSGEGRESTRIQYTGTSGPLFDNQDIFGFTTFRDIEFSGSNNNRFMTFKSGQSGNAQRLQFISCSFTRWENIVYCVHFGTMLSEVTFAYCKIKECTSPDSQLFVFDEGQAVNWRFDYTDIEGFKGSLFYYKKGSQVALNGGSIIPSENGNNVVFDFAIPSSDHEAGFGNAPQMYCHGTRFEMKNENTLLKVKKGTTTYPKVEFRTCIINAADSDKHHPSALFDIDGMIDLYLDSCTGCSVIGITCGNLDTNNDNKPTIKFKNCTDLDIEYLIDHCTYTNAVSDASGTIYNNLRVKVDNKYDFYLNGSGVSHTIFGLDECRQTVNASKYGTITLKDGKIIPKYDKTSDADYDVVKMHPPYGYVKYIELTVLKSNKFANDSDIIKANYPTVTATVIGKDTGKVYGSEKISFHKNGFYQIEVNEFMDEPVTIKFTYPETIDKSKTFNDVHVNMEIVKF